MIRYQLQTDINFGFICIVLINFLTTAFQRHFSRQSLIADIVTQQCLGMKLCTFCKATCWSQID